MIRTERLILDAWQSSDWTAFRPIATDPEVMRYITGGVPWTDEQIQAFVARQLKVYRERGFCRWKLIEKASENRSASAAWASGRIRRSRRSDGGWRAAAGAAVSRPKPPSPLCATPSGGCNWIG